MQDQIEFLKVKLLEKQALNSRFSLRAFSRFLGLSPSHLSNLLKGRRQLTSEAAHMIAERLNLSPKEQLQFLNSTANGSSSGTTISMSEQDFRLIADWYHLAILVLSKTKNAKANYSWVSKKLAISIEDTKAAVRRLVDRGLLVFGKDRFKQQGEYFVAQSEVKNTAFRKFHIAMLHKAEHALIHEDADSRFFSTRVFAVHNEQIPDAVQMIRQFQNDFSKRFGCENNGSRVYAISIQYYPIDQEEVN